MAGARKRSPLGPAGRGCWGAGGTAPRGRGWGRGDTPGACWVTGGPCRGLDDGGGPPGAVGRCPGPHPTPDVPLAPKLELAIRSVKPKEGLCQIRTGGADGSGQGSGALGSLLHSVVGEVSEWLKVPLSKSGVVMSHRGFESHPLRPLIGSRASAMGRPVRRQRRGGGVRRRVERPPARSGRRGRSPARCGTSYAPRRAAA